ncbi:MAG: hypothetical protein V1798_05020 [Pseudomonadota bacterium]
MRYPTRLLWSVIALAGIFSACGTQQLSQQTSTDNQGIASGTQDLVRRTGTGDNPGGGSVSLFKVVGWYLPDIDPPCVTDVLVVFNAEPIDKTEAHYRAISWIGGVVYETGTLYLDMGWWGNIRYYYLPTNGGCNPDYFAFGNKIEVTIDEATDQNGNVISGVSHTFVSNGFTIQ